jgi:hypothetical protein
LLTAELLQALASTAILGSESHGTHDRIGALLKSMQMIFTDLITIGFSNLPNPSSRTMALG